MSDDYLWVWADRSSRVTVLKVRGELDASTADQFTANAVRELRQTRGLVAVDLSFLDFIDCTGARALDAAVRSVPPCQLTEVRGIQPTVARLLELVGIDLAGLLCHGDVLLFRRGQELRTRARKTRMQSQQVLLETCAAMDRLAATYAGLAAAAQQHHAEQKQARAAHMRTLSDTAHDLAARAKERALCGPEGDCCLSGVLSPLGGSA